MILFFSIRPQFVLFKGLFQVKEAAQPIYFSVSNRGQWLKDKILLTSRWDHSHTVEHMTRKRSTLHITKNLVLITSPGKSKGSSSCRKGQPHISCLLFVAVSLSTKKDHKIQIQIHKITCTYLLNPNEM